jgi:hypothetical protein
LALGVVEHELHVDVLSDQALLDAAAQDRQAQCNDDRQPLAAASAHGRFWHEGT